LAIAILIAGYSRWMAGLQSDTHLSVSMLAVVIWWIGSFVFCFGSRIARLFLFPLCFLFWLVPIPTLVLDKIVAIWQQGSALSASLLFSALGVPVTQDGIMLSIPGLNLEVAQEQQFTLQPDAGGYQHGDGSSVSPLLLAESCRRPGGNSSLDCQEWGSNLHHLYARNPRRSRVSAWKPAPPGWHFVFLVGAVCGAAIDVVVKPRGEPVQREIAAGPTAGRRAAKIKNSLNRDAQRRGERCKA